jgi:tetratricopeptide (TPR) repeat protein
VALPEGVDPRTLDPDARRELRSLSKDTADLVAQHLVVTGQLLDSEPEQALKHARAAVALAGRVGVVREAAGLAAYTCGEWADALSELRAARRITGSPSHVSVMADCERALGRPERALRYADDPQVPQLTNAERVELVIVVSGARRDLGQHDAAVLVLQDPAKRTTAVRPWAARLWYAYADALLDAGREDEAREWFERAAEADEAGETDADERLMALDGIVFEDAYDGEDRDDDEPHAWVVPGAQEVMDGFSAALAAAADPSAGDPSGDPSAASAGEQPADDAPEPDDAPVSDATASAIPPVLPSSPGDDDPAAVARRATAGVPVAPFSDSAADGDADRADDGDSDARLF